MLALGGSKTTNSTNMDRMTPNHTRRAKLSWFPKPNVQYEQFIAGVSGGVVSTLILHPLDLIKIRFAVNDGKETGRPKYTGLRDAVRTILKQEGYRGFYRGVSPNVWGAGASWGIYFFLYSAIKKWMEEVKQGTLGPAGNMVAAAEAGVLTLAMTNPLWVVKTRLCLQYEKPVDPTKHYKGMLDALVKVYRIEGVQGLYKGFVPGIFGVSHGAIQFMTYEEMKRYYCELYELPITTKLSTLEYLSMAAISKLIAAVTTYPYQVIRARLQDKEAKYKGTIDAVRTTWRFEGLGGFYKGMIPYLCHVTPSICIIFVLYETMTTDGRR